MFPVDNVNDFSTNHHVSRPLAVNPARHPDLCFEDGNLAILAGHHYFLVHRGLLSRHSPVFAASIKALGSCSRRLEGRPVLQLDNASADHVYLLLGALYDGV